jgi:hypothetical protein
MRLRKNECLREDTAAHDYHRSYLALQMWSSSEGRGGDGP